MCNTFLSELFSQEKVVSVRQTKKATEPCTDKPCRFLFIDDNVSPLQRIVIETPCKRETHIFRYNVTPLATTEPAAVCVVSSSPPADTPIGVLVTVVVPSSLTVVVSKYA
jgi:hypothetical protein